MENPNERHKICSPVCELVLKSDNKNRPLKSPRLVLDDVDIRVDAIQSAQVEDLRIIAGVLKTAFQRAAVNKLFSNINRLEPDYELLYGEDVRLSTFYDWPSGAHADPLALAREGLFYTGSDDRVQCVFCRGFLRNWEPLDVPAVEHRRHFPDCSFVQGKDVGNIPTPRTDDTELDIPRDIQSRNETGSSGEIQRSEVIGCNLLNII